MEVTLLREVEGGSRRGGEDLVLLLRASFTGTKDELAAFLADNDRLRQAVVSSFDNYRGENGDEVEVCETEEEVAECKKSCFDFCFYRVLDGEEQFWVEKTDCYDHQFPAKPAEQLFDELTKSLQETTCWSTSLAEPDKWLFDAELDRTGNAE